MNAKEKVLEVIERLKKEYPTTKCTLNYSNPLELLIATRLAAQCTDSRVNSVTPNLFCHYKNVEDFSLASVYELEDYIKPCGFYHIKSFDIIEMCKKIKNNFLGNVPDNMKDLISLPGIGRKTANVILATIYGKPAIIVDTHFMRVTRRLGFHSIKDAKKIESIMKKIIPDHEQTKFSHRLVDHGRAVCKAKKPVCSACCLKDVCKFYVTKTII